MTKLLAVPIGVKGVAMAASAVAHVAFAFVSFSGGHVTSALAAAADPRSDEVEIDVPADPPPSQPPDPTAKPHPDDDHPHAVPHAARPHTHDYPVPPSHDAHPHDPRAVHLPLAPAAHDHDHEDAPAAPVVVAPPTAPMRVTITVGTGGNGANGTAAGGGGGGSPAPSSGGPSSEIVAEKSVSVPARAIVTARPVYPSAARAAEIEADVALEIVVDAGGAVVSARVARPAGYGLDDAAIQAIRRFRFAPAQRDGRAVGVRMRWVMQFRFQ